MVERKFTLKALPYSRKDWNHHLTFGAVPLSSLPSEYLLISTILNQGPTEDCTAFSACGNRESMLGKQFNPLAFYTAEGVETGNPSASGYTIRDEMLTGIHQGWKALDGSIDPNNYKANAFYSITGPYDLFDSVRSAIYLNSTNADNEKTPVIGGVMWYNEWTNPSGIIPETYSSQLGLHAVKIAGWTVIQGTMYIVIQNSWGIAEGSNGLFYFPRDVFNREFSPTKLGLYYWSDQLTPAQVKTDLNILAYLMQILQNIKKMLGLT